jgi:hypothetical protein
LYIYITYRNKKKQMYNPLLDGFNDVQIPEHIYKKLLLP